jgi:hypothetical protein
MVLQLSGWHRDTREMKPRDMGWVYNKGNNVQFGPEATWVMVFRGDNFWDFSRGFVTGNSPKYIGWWRHKK